MEINLLQSRLSLFTKNREAVQRDIEEWSQRCGGSCYEVEKLQQELVGIESEILNINVKIRSSQRDVIKTHVLIENLSDEDKKLIVLRYQDKNSLERISQSRVIPLSKSALVHRLNKILLGLSTAFNEV